MKKLILFLLFNFVFLPCFAQNYEKYMQQGQSFFDKKEFLTALERFDLAYEFAKNDLEKNNAKEWKNKSREKIKQYQTELKKSVKNTEIVLRYALNLSNTLDISKLKLYELFKSKGIKDFNRLNYFDAIRYLKMSKICPDYKSDVEVENYLSQSLDSLNSIKKIALVIGNGQYELSPLKNPTNDAEDIAKALDSINFKVILYLNLTHKKFNEEIINFSKISKDYQIVLFYFAGHAAQVNGANFLIPIDAKIQNEQDLYYEAISLNNLLFPLSYNQAAKKIFIMDAARNNPFARGSDEIKSEYMPGEVIECYATSPGSLSADGEGRNGLFTEQLLKYISIPNISFQEIFRLTREATIKSSNIRQIPAMNDYIQQNLYLNWKLD